MNDFEASLFLVSDKAIHINQVDGISQKSTKDCKIVKLSFIPFFKKYIKITTENDGTISLKSRNNEDQSYMIININGKDYISNRLVIFLCKDLLDAEWFNSKIKNENDMHLLIEILRYDRKNIVFNKLNSMIKDQKEIDEYAFMYKTILSIATAYKNPIDANVFQLFNDLSLIPFTGNGTIDEIKNHVLNQALELLYNFQYYALYASIVCLSKKTKELKVPILKTYHNCSADELDIFTQVFPITGILPLFICYNKYAHTKFVSLLATWGALCPADDNLKTEITGIVRKRIESMGYYTLEAVTPYIIFSRDYLVPSLIKDFKVSTQLKEYIMKLINHERPTLYHFNAQNDANSEYLKKRMEYLENRIEEEEDDVDEDLTLQNRIIVDEDEYEEDLTEQYAIEEEEDDEILMQSNRSIVEEIDGYSYDTDDS